MMYYTKESDMAMLRLRHYSYKLADGGFKIPEERAQWLVAKHIHRTVDTLNAMEAMTRTEAMQCISEHLEGLLSLDDIVLGYYAFDYEQKHGRETTYGRELTVQEAGLRTFFKHLKMFE